MEDILRSDANTRVLAENVYMIAQVLGWRPPRGGDGINAYAMLPIVFQLPNFRFPHKIREKERKNEATRNVYT